jgi:hypothetical protein
MSRFEHGQSDGIEHLLPVSSARSSSAVGNKKWESAADRLGKVCTGGFAGAECAFHLNRGITLERKTHLPGDDLDFDNKLFEKRAQLSLRIEDLFDNQYARPVPSNQSLNVSGKEERKLLKVLSSLECLNAKSHELAILDECEPHMSRSWCEGKNAERSLMHR